MELERLLKKGEGIEALITIGVEPNCINTPEGDYAINKANVYKLRPC